MRRQTITSGINPAGASCAQQQLDPLSLPAVIEACDARADGGVRHVRIGRDAVIVRRTVHGMGMTIRIRIGDYLGIALRELHGARVLLLKHRDPSLSIPLASASDGGDLFDACRDWSETLRLPMGLVDGRSSLREPTARRRRRNAVKARRASILMRRKNGRDMALMNVYRGEREIIART